MGYKDKASNLPAGKLGLNLKNAYPFFQLLGDPGDASVPRGFFLPESQFPKDFTVPDKYLIEVAFDGERKRGLFLETLQVAPLAYRIDAFVGHEDGSKTFYDNKDDAQAAQGARERVSDRVRFLVLVKALAEGFRKEYPAAEVPDAFYGPYILTVSGTKGYRLVDAFKDFQRRFAVPLSRQDGQTYPDYMFWVPLAVGEPIPSSKNFPKTKIVPPVLNMPEKVDVAAAAEKLYIGDHLAELAAGLLEEAGEWAEAPITSNFGEPITRKARREAEERGEEDEIEFGQKAPFPPKAPAPARRTFGAAGDIDWE